MNIKETKQAFKNDVKTENYHIDEVRKLHLNVNQVETTINNELIIFGYSYETIIMFSLKGYNFITQEMFSTSTQKHKSQVLDNLYRNINRYLPAGLFDHVLDQVLEGKELELSELQDYTQKNYQVIKTDLGEVENAFDYLSNYDFVSNENQIKDIIKGKMWHKDSVILNCVPIEKTKNGYSCPLVNQGKEYKTLSILNHLNLKTVNTIL